jgi:hypothetical protein
MKLCPTPCVLKTLFAVIALAGLATSLIGLTAGAQTAGRAGAQVAGRGGRGAASAAAPDANLLQLMRGVLYPASNVIFAAQNDLDAFPPVDDPATSPNPITSAYGGWEAVSNAAMALAESTRLLTVSGRMCSTNRPAPVERADWQQFTVGLREVALRTYRAAQTKSTDNMLDAAGELAEACANCHNVYREKPGGERDRCLP